MKKILNKIIFGLNMLVVAALLVAYLAPFINPSKFLIPALLGLAYPYIILANLLFLFYYLIRLKKEFIISLAVILLGWNHLNNLIPFHFHKDRDVSEFGDHTRIKVLSYNVRSFNVYNWSNEANAREEIFRFINEQDPDILCMQEYFTSPGKGDSEMDIDRRFAGTPFKSVYYGYVKEKRSAWGIATYSRYPIVKRSRIPFSNSTNVAMYTDILLNRDTVRVFNVHLQSIKFRERNYAFMDTLRLKYSNEQMAGFRDIGSHLKQAFIQRSEQAEVISGYINQSPHPVIVMGDFNDTPVSYAYRKIKRGLNDAFRVSGKGFGNTYAGELPSFRIDFIMYSDPILSSGFKRTKNKYSDHFPIKAYLYLPD